MDCTGLYLSELDFAVLYWSSLDGTGLLQLVDCTTLYLAVLDCTRLYPVWLYLALQVVQVIQVVKVFQLI